MEEFLLTKSKKIWLEVAIIIGGFTSIIGQSILIRELASAFYGNELSLGIFLASWLFWVAMGSFGMGKLGDKFNLGMGAYIFNQILISILFPLTIFVVKTIKLAFGIPGGELIGYFPIILSSFTILAPVSIVIGVQFVLGFRIYFWFLQNASKSIGRVYIFDALGIMLGGFAFGYILVNIFNCFQTIFYAVLINLTMSLILLGVYCPKKKLLKGIAFLGILLSLWCAIYGNKIDRFTTSLNWKDFVLVETATSKYSNFTLVKRGNLYSFYQNGVLSFTNPDEISCEELVHFSLLETKNAQRILITGGAVGGALQEILKYSVKEVYYIEHDPLIVKLAEMYITPSDLKALHDPRVKLIHTDIRFFIKKYKGTPFDCIILNVGDPSTAGRNRFYTIEFFKEIKSILNPEGVVTLCISSNENYLGSNMLEFNGCIYQTLKKVFSNIILIPGEKLFLVASPGGSYLTFDAQVLSHRLDQHKIKTKFVNKYYLPYRFYPERISYIKGLLENFKEAKINYDFHPVCYYFAMTLWGGQFSNKIDYMLSSLSKIKLKWLAFFVVILSILLLLSRSFAKKLYVPIGVFTAGVAGISIEIILVIGFQVLYGYIYHMIGIIIASFMLGIVLGTGWMNRRLDLLKKKNIVLAGLELTYALYLILLPKILKVLPLFSFQALAVVSVQILFPFLTILAGLIMGMIFPLANKIYLNDEEKLGRVGGMLYASDLVGACLGSFLSAVLLIPIFGIPETCLLLALLNLMSFMLLLSLRRT